MSKTGIGIFIAIVLAVVILVLTQGTTTRSDERITMVDDTLSAIVNDGSQLENDQASEQFPFKSAHSALILSYQDRSTWTQVKPHEQIEVETDSSRYIIMKGKDLTSRIKERVEVQGENLERFFSIFHSTQCGLGTISFCYNPRHLILFYDQEEVLLGAVELCLDCSNGLASEGIDFPSFCSEKSDELKSFFEEVGVTYFGE